MGRKKRHHRSRPTPRSRPAEAQQAQLPSPPTAISHRPESRRFLVGLAILFAASLALRVVHAQSIDASPTAHLLLGDAESYTNWATSLASGNWTGDEVFYQAPLYPYFLGMLFSLFDSDPSVIRTAHALLGALACVFLALAGRSWFSPSVGLVAGALLAIYGPAIFFVGLVQKTTLALAAFTLLLWLLGMASDSSQRGLRLWLAVGVTVAATALARENALIVAAPIALWIVLAPHRQPHGPAWRWKRLAAFAAGLAVILGTVAIRNYAVGGDVAVTTSQLGTNLYIGNNPSANGTYQPLRAGRDDTRFESSDAHQIAEQTAGRRMSPTEVSSFYVGAVVDYIREDPVSWLRLMARKVLLAVNAVELADTEDLTTHASYSNVLRLTQRWWHFGTLLPLALMGVALGWSSDRQHRGLLHGLVLAYGLGLVAFFVFARYRVLVVPILMLFAAAGLFDLWGALRARRAKSIALAFMAALLAIGVSRQPLLDVDTMQAVTHYNYGLGFERQGRDDLARSSYTRALSFQPNSAEAHFRVGVLEVRESQLDSARTHFESAARLSPDFQAVHNSLGALLLEQGDTKNAEHHFRQALRLLPGDTQALNNLATIAFRRRDMEQARALYQQSLDADPDNPQTHNNLGILAAIRGELGLAVGYFEDALALDPGYEEARLNLARAQRGT